MFEIKIDNISLPNLFQSEKEAEHFLYTQGYSMVWYENTKEMA